MTDPPPERDPRTYILIGAAMEVHRIVGAGFGESIVTDAFAIELQLRKVPFMTEVPFPIIYKGHRLPGHYRADFVCFDSVVVEIKVMRIKTGLLEQGHGSCCRLTNSGDLRAMMWTNTPETRRTI